MTGPTVAELLSGDLAELSRRYGVRHSTLWNRRDTIWNGHRSHADTCVTQCAGGGGPVCDVEHACWCPIGGLTYAEYLETRPPVVGRGEAHEDQASVRELSARRP